MTSSKASTTRRAAWRRLFPPGAAAPLAALSLEAQAHARRGAGLILAAHRGYLAEFNALTAKAKETFETRAWTQGALDAGRRVQLYRDAVNGTWRKLQRLFPERAPDREFWMGVRQAFLETAFDEYEADIALTFLYSTMRLAFDAQDTPVEYADDGLAERSHVRSPRPVWRLYRAAPQRLTRSVVEVLTNCAFRAPFENSERDAALVTERLLAEWTRQIGAGYPRDLQMLEPLFFRDREAYLVGKLRAGARELPVVLALRHEERGITVDAVLAGREDMRNILFVSTRSTFNVRTGAYREVLQFLDTLARASQHSLQVRIRRDGPRWMHQRQQH